MKKLKTVPFISAMALIMVVLGFSPHAFANYTDIPGKFSLDATPVCLFLDEISTTSLPQAAQPAPLLYSSENGWGENFSVINTTSPVETNFFRPILDFPEGDILTATQDVTFNIYRVKTPEELANSLSNGFSVLLESNNQGKMNLFSTNIKNQQGVHHAPIPSSALLLSTVLIGLIGFRWRTASAMN